MARNEPPRIGTDEVYEVGDSSVVDSTLRRPYAPAPKTSAAPWVLLTVLVFGAAAAGYFYVWPMKLELHDLAERHAVIGKELETKQGQLTALEQQNGELLARERSLKQTVEEQAVQLKELEGTQHELESKLKEEIDRGDILIKQVAGELIVDVQDQLLFPSGEAELNPQGKEVLQRVGETLAKSEGRIVQVAGHTDNLPISDKLKKEFPSNWELSAKRALNVVHFLEDDVKMPGERLVVVGNGQFKPIGKNDTKEGRKKNRRIELTLLPRK